MASSNPVVSNAPILEVLNRNNYKHWRSRMKAYLLSEDLWEVVQASRREPAAENLQTEYDNAWTKKNAKAVYAIQNSCGREMFSFISETETAKGAWEALEKVSKLTEKSEYNFEPYIPFTNSVSRGDWNKAKECLREVDVHIAVRAVDPRDGFGDIALHVAARQGHVHIVKELVALMALEDLKMKNAKGFTALHVAAWNGQVNTLKELVLFMGKEKDSDGDTALHMAVHKGKVDIVKALVQFMREEDLKIKNNNGSTALHLAVKKGIVPIVKELGMLMGELGDCDGDTALHTAVNKGHVDIVNQLGELMRVKRQEDLAIKNNKGYTALNVAVMKGDVDIVKELVRLMRQEDLAIKNDEGYTALHIAVKMGNVRLVKEFVTKYEGENNITEDDFKQYIPFTDFVKNNDWDQANERLRELPCRNRAITAVDPRDGCRDTVLHVAARQEQERIVKELVSILRLSEKDLELKTTEDFTAFCSNVKLDIDEGELMKKAKYMVEQYVQTLGSILDVQNAKGCTALHEAVLVGNADIVKELVPLMRPEGFELKNNNGETTLHQAASEGNANIVKELAPWMRKTGLEIKDVFGRTALHNAAWNGSVNIVNELAPLMIKTGLEIKDVNGDSPLHIAIKKGNMDIVRVLVPLMRAEAMEVENGEGYTALGCAINIGKDEHITEMATYMNGKNKKVFGIATPPNNWIPVVWAFNWSRWELASYLYSLTPREFLNPENRIDGSQLITLCFRAKQLDIGLDLLQNCPSLAISANPYGSSPIVELAGMHSAFLSGTQLGFWHKLIYDRIRMEPANLNNHDTSINISRQVDDRHKQMDLTRSVIRLYRQLVNGLLKLLGVDRLRKMKWIHTRSIDVLRCISEMIKNDNLTSVQLDIVKTSIFKAVEHGHVEFVTHMCQARPKFVKSDDESNKNIFQFAVECRQNKIYSLIHGLEKEDKKFFGFRVTTFPENMLHLAGNLSPPSRFNHIRGPALQMQRELQWFKEVEKIVPLEMHEISNSDGMTPRELFTKNHEKLKEEAENSMKGTATSCTVVGALIVTIMFAAAFTVPGGNNDGTGTPMLLDEKLFLVFIISDTLSLVFSTTSVMLFLGILTSRYAEDDFLKDLPTKMLIGLFTLFLSIATMMIAYSAALIIMLEKKYSWAVIPCISVACIPVASFIWLQFPLLIETFMSTYGPGIFDKKVKQWVKLESQTVG